MNKFMVVDGDYVDKMKTRFDYEVGEILTYNGDSRIKCVGIETTDDEIFYLFKEGRKVFIYD